MPLLAPGQVGEAGYEADTVLGEWPIDLGELRLDRVDEFGGLWNVTAFTGRGSAPSAIESGQRVTGHGSWIGGRWWAAKPYTIDIAYEGETPQDRHAAEQRLLATVGLGDVDLVMFEEVTRRTAVILNGEVAIDPVNAYAFTAQVPLLATDPFRYGLEERTAGPTGLPAATGGLAWPATWPVTWNAVVTSGRMTLENAGTAEAFPVFRVFGPLPDFTLVDQSHGHALTVSNPDGQTLAAGEFLDVDMSHHRVLLMGTGSRRSWASGEWFGLPPGDTEVGFSASVVNAEALLTATWHDTYN